MQVRTQVVRSALQGHLLRLVAEEVMGVGAVCPLATSGWMEEKLPAGVQEAVAALVAVAVAIPKWTILGAPRERVPR